MARESNERQQPGRSSAFASADFGLSAYAAMFDGFAKLGTSVGDACAEMGQEWLSFLSQRFQEDVELTQRLVRCTSPQELTREWSSFFANAAKAYQAEWQRLAEMGTVSVREVGSAVERNSEEVARRAIARAN